MGPKAEIGSVKDIGKRIKSKGLQKLKFYCQLCEKQCRDSNGFKCHLTSDGHLRQMKLFSENTNQYMDQYSKEFQKLFLDTLRMRHSTTKVNANQVYQEVIRDRNHIHMNSTIWVSLTDFCKYLGKHGKCIVEETERGWYIQYIERDATILARQEMVQQKMKNEQIAEQIVQQRMEYQRTEAAKQLDKVGGVVHVVPTSIRRTPTRNRHDDDDNNNNNNSTNGKDVAEEEEEEEEYYTTNNIIKLSLGKKSVSSKRTIVPSKSVFDEEDDDDEEEKEKEKEEDIEEQNFKKDENGDGYHNQDKETYPKQLQQQHLDKRDNEMADNTTNVPSQTTVDKKNSIDTQKKRRRSHEETIEYQKMNKDYTNKEEEEDNNKEKRKQKYKIHTNVQLQSEQQPWLYRNIIVRIITKELENGIYFRKKAIVDSIYNDGYSADVIIVQEQEKEHDDDNDDHGTDNNNNNENKNNSNNNIITIRIDQDDLQTVAPKHCGDKVRIVKGNYRGYKAKLIDLDKKMYTAVLQLKVEEDEKRNKKKRKEEKEETNRIVLENVSFDDFSKIAY